MPNTIVLVIRKSDNAVMPIRESAPHHRPGNMMKLVIEKHGGTTADYFEMIVPPEDVEAVLFANELEYNPIQKQVKITPYSEKEVGLKMKNAELMATEEAVVRAALFEAKAIELGLDEKRYSKEKADKEKDAAKLKKDIDDLEALPDGDG